MFWFPEQVWFRKITKPFRQIEIKIKDLSENVLYKLLHGYIQLCNLSSDLFKVQSCFITFFHNSYTKNQTQISLPANFWCSRFVSNDSGNDFFWWISRIKFVNKTLRYLTYFLKLSPIFVGSFEKPKDLYVNVQGPLSSAYSFTLIWTPNLKF